MKIAALSTARTT